MSLSYLLMSQAMDSYTMIFMTMEVIFIMIVMILALKMNKNIGTFSEIRHFWYIQITFIIGALTEILWALQNARLIRLLNYQAWVMNGISVLSFSILLYEWFRFIANEVLKLEEDSLVFFAIKIQRVIVCFDILMTVSSVVTGLVYRIDANAEYSRGAYYWLHSVFCYSHWVWTTVLIIHYLKKRGLKERKQLYDMFTVSLFPFLGGIIYILYNKIPFLDASIMLGTLLIFIDLQENQITTDALTGLNNRSDFVRMYDKMVLSAEAHPFFIFVADIDKFKRINDKYGNLAGDQALLLVAKGLRRIGSRHHSLYICRYGGDEFVMLGLCKDIESADTFAEQVNEALDAETKKAKLGFQITFSIGYQRVESKETKLKEVFEKADMMLYEKKRGYAGVNVPEE